MIEIGSSIIGSGENSGSSIHSAWFVLAITWQSVQGSHHD